MSHTTVLDRPSPSPSRPVRAATGFLCMLGAVVLLGSPARAQEPDLRGARSAISKLVGFDAVQLADLSESAVDGVLDVAVAASVRAQAFQSKPGTAAWHVAIRTDEPRRLSPALPAAFEGAATVGVLMISSPKDESVELALLPAEVRPGVAGFAVGGKLDLKAGLNLFSAMRAGPAGVPGLLCEVLNIEPEFLLGGQLDATTANEMLRAVGFPAPNALAPGLPTTRMGLTAIFPGAVPPPFDLIGDKELLDMEIQSTRVHVVESTKTVKDKTSEAYEISGTQGVTIWLNRRRVDLNTTLGIKFLSGKTLITRTGRAKFQGPDLFGLPGFHVDELSLGGLLTVPEQGEVGLGMDLGATLSLPKHGQLKGTFSLGFKEQKFTELQLSLRGADPESGIDLGALPGYGQIPGVNELRFDELTIGINPEKKDAYVSGAVTWKEKDITGRAALVRFTTKSKKALMVFLECEGLSLRKLAPALPEQTDVLSMDRALIAFSSEDLLGLSGDSLPGPVKEMVGRIMKDMSAEMRVFKGVTAFMAFDPANLPGELGRSVEQFGVTEPLVLAGSIGGLKDKLPQIALYADLPRMPLPEQGFDFLKRRENKTKATDVGAKFFLMVAMGGAGPELRLGVEGGVGVDVAGDELDLSGQAFVLLSALDQGVRISGRVDGTWDEPLGLTGLRFEDFIVGGGVDASTSIEVAVGGTARIGKFDYELAGLISLIAGSGGLVPEKVGLSFEGSELSILTQFQLMGAFVKSAVSGPLASAIPPGETQALLRKVNQVDLVSSVEDVIPLPYYKWKDVKVYLVTPGASFPGLDLDGMGVGAGGTLTFMDRDLKETYGGLTLRDGMTVYQRLGDVELGVLALNDALFDLRVPMPGLLNEETAHLIVTGAMDAGCSLVSSEIELRFGARQASFTAAAQLAERDVTLEASVDLDEWREFALLGELPDDLAKDVLVAVKETLAAESKQALDAVKRKQQELDQKVADGKTALANAKTEGRKVIVGQVKQKVTALHSYVQQQANQSPPVVKKAWQKARQLTGKVKVAKDGTVQGIQEVRQQLDALAGFVSKLPSKGAAQLKGALAEAKRRTDEVVNAAKDIGTQVAQLPAVQKAEGAWTQATARLSNFKQTLMDEHIDPIAAYASELTETVTIDHIGFNSDLGVLCRGQLPMFNIRGTFAGKPFNLRNALQLASSRDFRKRNTKHLGVLVQELLALIDPAEADAFTATLGK